MLRSTGDHRSRSPCRICRSTDPPRRAPPIHEVVVCMYLARRSSSGTAAGPAARPTSSSVPSSGRGSPLRRPQPQTQQRSLQPQLPRKKKCESHQRGMGACPVAFGALCEGQRAGGPTVLGRRRAPPPRSSRYWIAQCQVPPWRNYYMRSRSRPRPFQVGHDE